MKPKHDFLLCGTGEEETFWTSFEFRNEIFQPLMQSTFYQLSALQSWLSLDDIIKRPIILQCVHLNRLTNHHHLHILLLHPHSPPILIQQSGTDDDDHHHAAKFWHNCCCACFYFHLQNFASSSLLKFTTACAFFLIFFFYYFQLMGLVVPQILFVFLWNTKK